MTGIATAAALSNRVSPMSKEAQLDVAGAITIETDITFNCSLVSGATCNRATSRPPAL